jgi:hypothetical protein
LHCRHDFRWLSMPTADSQQLSPFPEDYAFEAAEAIEESASFHASQAADTLSFHAAAFSHVR